MCGIFASFIDKKENSLQHQDHINCIEGNVLQHRGPDGTYTKDITSSSVNAHLVFHRLAIMGLGSSENDILHDSGVYLIANGEIYKHKDYAETLKLKLETDSDCEVILKMYTNFINNINYEDSLQLLKYVEHFKNAVLKLDGVFAFIIWDSKREIILAGRDRIGVRPLFYILEPGKLAFASEEKGLLVNSSLNSSLQDPAKGLLENSDNKQYNDPSKGLLENSNNKQYEKQNTKQFPPGHILIQTKGFTHFESYWNFPKLSRVNWNTSKNIINILLTEAVRKRLISDRPIGFLLSGGLDSSLIASIANRFLGKITTFSIGYENSSDLIAARKVAEYLDSDHHEVILKDIEITNCLHDLIWSIGSRDITTIRASMPMYLLSKYISENTDIKVLFSGEGSDEIFAGYLYLHKAPDYQSLQDEIYRLVSELHLFDVRRADRTTARWGLELRVPFLDADFLDFVLAMDPSLKMGGKRLEKQVLRDSFIGYLTDEILYRKKEAFSDGVGSRSVELLKSLAEEHRIKNLSLEDKVTNYNPNYAIPITDEAKFYYDIHRSLFGEYDDTTHYWMPKWSPEANNDPSARFLSNY